MGLQLKLQSQVHKDAGMTKGGEDPRWISAEHLELRWDGKDTGEK